MRGDVEGDGGLAEVFLENGIDGAGREALAELGDKERAFENPGSAAVNLHRFHGVGTDGHETFLGALSHHANTLVDRVDVVEVKRGQFGEAESGRVKELEDGGVALTHPTGSLAFKRGLHGKGEEFFDLGQSENNGEGLIGFRELDFRDWALGVTTTVDEKFVKGTIGRETEPDRATGEFGLLKFEKVGAEMVGSEVPPFREAVAVPLAEESQGEGVVLERLR